MVAVYLLYFAHFADSHGCLPSFAKSAILLLRAHPQCTAALVRFYFTEQLHLKCIYIWRLVHLYDILQYYVLVLAMYIF